MRPITGFGATPFSPDLQGWTRDAHLSPDWLRVGVGIVGGSQAPTFNFAFTPSGQPVDSQSVPEPSTLLRVSLAVPGSPMSIRVRRPARQG